MISNRKSLFYVQGVKENMRHADFFTSYKRPHEKTRLQSKSLINVKKHSTNFSQIWFNLMALHSF